MGRAGQRKIEEQQRQERVLEAIRAGNTRRAACRAGGISEDTLARRIAESAEFAELLAQAESEAERRNVATLQKAADGYDVTERVQVTKTIFRRQKTTTVDANGVKTIVEEDVPHEVTEITESVRREFDWRPALEWLKRRRKDGDESWSERLEQVVTGSLDVSTLSDEELEALRSSRLARS